MGRFRLELSDQNPNTRDRSEEVFVEGGHWEKNQGRRQTRRFAECFHRRVRLPWSEFSVLDVGCALGDALSVWRREYPSAKLYGCDVAESAVRRCQECYGNMARFFRASFEEIDGHWDVIYCSNVLEHFEQFLEIAGELLLHCKLLFVLTPFGELRNGALLRPSAERYYHVATFYRDALDDLIRSGKASKVETTIFSCPRGGWGFTRVQRIRWLVSLILGGHYIVQEPLQIIYGIHSSQWPTPDVLHDEGRYCP
jgi:SAM-dependent methyltransferase